MGLLKQILIKGARGEGMNKDEIIRYIEQNNGAEVAAVQQKFGITYKESKEIINRLVDDGVLVYEGGVRYAYVKREPPALYGIRGTDYALRRKGSFVNETDCDRGKTVERRAQLEARRRELWKRLRADDDEDDDIAEDDDLDLDSDDDEEDETDKKFREYNEYLSGLLSDMVEDSGDGEDEEMDEDELRYKALKLSIERNSASVSLFQRTFPIGYNRACELIDWMESMGYISTAAGSRPRNVLITQDEFDKLYNSTHCEEAIRLDAGNETGEEELRRKALELCITKDRLSASTLACALRIDYIKACELVEWMTDNGYISLFDGTLERKVLITREEYDKLYENDDIVDDAIINDVFHSDEDEYMIPGDYCKPKGSMQELVDVIDKIIGKKKAPVSADAVPPHNLWLNEEEFGEVVMERLERLIKSDKKMGQKGAVKKAETYLEAVRDTHDGKMVQVYERLVYELKNTSAYVYKQLKKQFFLT